VCGGDDDFAFGVDEDAAAGAFFAFVHAVYLRLVRAGEVVLDEDGFFAAFNLSWLCNLFATKGGGAGGYYVPT
jgi:hypothetical protein